MLPEKFVEEVERAEKLSRMWRVLGLLLVFSITFLIAAPLVHEFSHMAALKAFGCRYSVNWGVSLTGISAGVQPLCALQGFGQIFFYSAGYVSMIVVGGLLSVLSIERNNSFLVNEFSSVVASGFLVSLVFTLELQGDLENILNVLGLRPINGELIYLLIVLGASSLLYLLAHNLLDQNGSAAARGRL